VDTRPLFIANWKMNLPEEQVTSFLTRFLPVAPPTNDRAIVVAPSFPSLRTASILLERTGIEVAAQDLFHEERGAFTGGVSATMLEAVGCKLVLVGHSERRQIWGEDDATVQRKMKAASAHDLQPVLCLGESADERRQGRTFAVVERQLRKGLEGIPLQEDAAFAVAYEPVWAIGTGDSASPDQAQEVHRHLRGLLGELFPGRQAALRLLYGGSVTKDTAAELMAQEDINGLLVGTASLDPDSFAAICSCPLEPGS
jgi:triosephosphate isomerase